MDAGTYLRRKRECMTQYISRNVVVPESLRIEAAAKKANTVYNLNPAKGNVCCPKGTGFGGGAVTPIRGTPGSTGCCNTTGGAKIRLQGCPIPYDAPAAYVSEKPCCGYTGTRAQQTEASRIAVNRDLGRDCCNSVQ
jgi:hypothetical protein